MLSSYRLWITHNLPNTYDFHIKQKTLLYDYIPNLG